MQREGEGGREGKKGGVEEWGGTRGQGPLSLSQSLSPSLSLLPLSPCEIPGHFRHSLRLIKMDDVSGEEPPHPIHFKSSPPSVSAPPLLDDAAFCPRQGSQRYCIHAAAVLAIVAKDQKCNGNQIERMFEGKGKIPAGSYCPRMGGRRCYKSSVLHVQIGSQCCSGSSFAPT